MEIISLTCDCGSDPRSVHIVALVGGIQRVFEIPEPIYAEISGPLGWPPNPCDDCE